MSSEESESAASKSWSIHPIGAALLILGGLLVKLALILWLSVVGYILIVFGVVTILSLNQKSPNPTVKRDAP